MRSLISLLLLASAPLAAQQVARFITWPEVERRALDSPAAVKLAQANAGASRAAALGTRVARYPAIQANFSSVAAPDDGTRLGTGTGSLTNPIIFPRTAYGVTISQLITDFGRSSHLTQAAVQRSFADQQTAKQAELQVRLLARQAYLAVWRAQALERLARRQLDQVRAAGRPLAESELQLTLARNECMTAAIDLSSLIGEHDLAAPYEVPELLDTRPVTTDIGELMAAALRQNPEVEQRRRILKAAEEQVRAERAGRWPVVTGLATLGYAPLHSARFGRSDFTVVGLTIGLPMPLTAAHRAKLAETQLRVESAQASVQEAETHVVRNISAALVALSSASARLALARVRDQQAAADRDQAAARTQLVQAQHDVAWHQEMIRYYAAEPVR